MLHFHECEFISISEVLTTFILDIIIDNSGVVMQDLNSNIQRTSAYLSTLPVESRIEFNEKILDDLARSIWGDSFNERGIGKMESAAGRMLNSVKQARKLALQILELEED